jgi:hypothetical protein
VITRAATRAHDNDGNFVQSELIELLIEMEEENTLKDHRARHGDSISFVDLLKTRFPSQFYPRSHYRWALEKNLAILCLDARVDLSIAPDW